jgi:SAM-dependent methyltransferase
VLSSDGSADYACARYGGGGCRICVELGTHLAAVARRNLAHFPQVDVVTSAFETWAPHGAVFDMVFAATSWHWPDPTVRYAKAARVLQPGGALAFVSCGHAFPAGFDPFFTGIQSCYDSTGESAGDWPPGPYDVMDESTDIQSSGLFGDFACAVICGPRSTRPESTLTCSIPTQATVGCGLPSRSYSTLRRDVKSTHDREAGSARTTSAFIISPACCPADR